MTPEQEMVLHQLAMDYRCAEAVNAHPAWLELYAHVESLISAARRAGMEQAAGIAHAEDLRLQKEYGTAKLDCAMTAWEIERAIRTAAKVDAARTLTPPAQSDSGDAPLNDANGVK